MAIWITKTIHVTCTMALHSDIINALFGDLQSRNIHRIYILKRDTNDKWIWTLNAKAWLSSNSAADIGVLIIWMVTAYVPTVVEAIKNTTERLIELGAVNLVVPGNPPSGCFSGILALLSRGKKGELEPDTGCLKSANGLIRYHNRLLYEAVEDLRKKHPHVIRLAYANFYTPIIKFAKSPDKFGFSNETVLRACCGGGGAYNYNLQAICGLPGSSTCAKPSAAMNWDGWHGTEAMYRRIAGSWLRKL
ncbi:GDSL esterase/lipase [Canna indica]|uniref:GDSL esterase/lipase n=1 Tax=Canna indica TaxID=4628 RepID=A0AAQ3K7D2_9LILI|nr:GDSL esterase/lipase [Canna indica]